MKRALIPVLLCAGLLLCGARDERRSAPEPQNSLERRQKAQIKGFFLKDAQDAQLPTAPMAIQLFNDAVGYYQKQDYVLAREALKESLSYDDANALAYELLGDIDNREQKLKDAKSNYEIAYNLEPRAALKEKIEKLGTETTVEKKLATYGEEHFVIRYQKDSERDRGFELRELLRTTYREVSRDFGFYFRSKVVVILYDEEDFKEITKLPHWVAGVYDGKVRMPINRRGFTDTDLKALTRHEVTHAFIAGMSDGRAPAWINEGLAEYEEAKVKKEDWIVFRSAVKTNTLMPLDELMAQGGAGSIKDPLLVSLFYEQSHHLVNYLVGRYGMFKIKEFLQQYAKGKNSDEAVREVFKVSPERLEREWKATFTSASR